MQFHRATVSGVITGNPACDQNAWQKMVADSKTWIVHFWPYFSAVKGHWCWPVFEHVRKALMNAMAATVGLMPLAASVRCKIQFRLLYLPIYLIFPSEYTHPLPASSFDEPLGGAQGQSQTEEPSNIQNCRELYLDNSELSS